MILEIPFYQIGYATIFALGVVAGIAFFKWRQRKACAAFQQTPGVFPFANFTHFVFGNKKPVPLFGYPFLRRNTPAGVSWWYIPIQISGGRKGNEGRLDYCTIYISPLRKDDFQSTTMHWHSRDRDAGEKEITLISGRVFAVPVAIRCEKGISAGDRWSVIADGQTRLTDDRAMMSGFQHGVNVSGHIQIPFHLSLHSGGRIWRSGLYFLDSPNSEDATNERFILSNSNGHFDF